MAQRGTLPVLQYRGKIRATMRRAESALNSLRTYQTKHPNNPPFSAPDLQKIVDVVTILTASLAARIKV